MKNTESRPRLKWGIFAGVIGLLNLIHGPSEFFRGTLDSTVDGMVDTVVGVLLLLFGYWLARKRVVVGENSLRLIGVVDGKSDITLPIDQVTHVAFNHLRQKVEIQTASEKLYANLPETSAAFSILIGAIHTRNEESKLA